MTTVENTENSANKYQAYSSSVPMMRMVTPTGRHIIFTDGSFITDNSELIQYLDGEIAAGLNVITKGEKVATPEKDPMAGLRERIIAEYFAAQSANAGKDFGDTESKGKLGGATTSQKLAAMTAGSTSS